MNIKETLDKIKKCLPDLVFSSTYNSGNTATPYSAQNLVNLKETINELSNIDFIENQIKALKNSVLFTNFKDQDMFSATDETLISSTVRELKIGLEYLLNYYYKTKINIEEIIQVKLPELESFEELIKTTNDLKKAIEIPITESNTEGKIKILTAESGSIWFIISVGTINAVSLIGGICWAAAVVRKKRAEAKIFEAHAKTLDLKNNALEYLISAQKEQFDNILVAEAEAIMSKYYDHKEPETLARLKLSVSTIADLIDRGAKILPNSESDNIKNLFPDYNNLNLISSAIKQLNDGLN